MKYGGGMNELPYPSDLTAAQWALIEPLLPAPKLKGQKRRVDLRKITNAILYVLKGGISWRMLPREFAPWKREGSSGGLLEPFPIRRHSLYRQEQPRLN